MNDGTSVHKISKKINSQRAFLVMVVVISNILMLGLGYILYPYVNGLTQSQNNASHQPAQAYTSTTSDITITYPDDYDQIAPVQHIGPNEGLFVGSINGTKYYPKGCSSANRIKETNQTWFVSEEQAQMAGYERTSQCRF
jgi:hypothetical protein